MLIIVLTLAVTLVLPATVAGLLAGSTAVLAVVLGVTASVAGAMRSGWTRMARAAPIMAVASGVAAFTGTGWAWVVLMATLGALAGIGLPRGYAPAVLFAGMPAVFLADPLSLGTAVLVGVFAGLAATIGVLLARHLNAAPSITPPAVAEGLEWLFGPLLMVVLGGGAAIAVGAGLAHGYWIVLTLIVVGAALAAGDTHRNRQRLLGNVGGLAITIPLSFLPLPAWAFYGLALVLLVWSFTYISHRYWLYALLESSAVVLLVSAGQTGSGILETGEARAGATLIGCAIVALLVMVLRVVLPRLPRVTAAAAVDG